MMDAQSVRNRLEAQSIPEPNSGCWLWAGYVRGDGYARSKYRYKRYYAHRLSWIVHYGAIPDDLVVMHKCDVRSCVNPNHLRIGTSYDNTHDMINKGRRVIQLGEAASNTKLTTEQVLAIRQSNKSHPVLARKHGVSPSNIGAIKRRRSWAWLV